MRNLLNTRVSQLDSCSNRKLWAAAIAGTVSIILSLNVTLGCNYVELEGPSGFTNNRGIWFVQTRIRIGDTDRFRAVCAEYPHNFDIDLEWRMTRLLTLLGGLSGCVVVSLIWSCTFSPLNTDAWYKLTVASIYCGILQGSSTLFIYSVACMKSSWIKEVESRHCYVATGFYTNAASTVLWILTSLIMAKFPPYGLSKKKTDIFSLGVRRLDTAEYGDALRTSVLSENVPHEPHDLCLSEDGMLYDEPHDLTLTEDGMASSGSSGLSSLHSLRDEIHEKGDERTVDTVNIASLKSSSSDSNSVDVSDEKEEEHEVELLKPVLPDFV